MQVNFQNNSAYNSGFGARIIKTDYLNAGLEYAKKYADISDAKDFLNAIKHISNDTKMDTFCIRGVEGSTIKPGQARRSQVEINGHKAYVNEGFIGFIHDGPQCISALQNFIYRHYGEEVAEKVFKQSNTWLRRAEQLQKREEIVLQKGQQEVLNALNDITF